MNPPSIRGKVLNVRGVLIDLGDTLTYVDKEANWDYERAIHRLLKNQGHDCTLDDIDHSLSRIYRASTTGDFRNLQQFWTAFLKGVDVPLGRVLIRNLEEVRRRWAPKMFKLHEAVLPTLSVLKKKYRLALVSNCAIGIMDVIERLRLTEYFEHLLLSYEVGARKPDKRIYLRALEAMRLKADECVFVADEISDLEGANALGFHTLLVRQGASTYCEAKNLEFKPDFECDRFCEVIRYL